MPTYFTAAGFSAEVVNRVSDTEAEALVLKATVSIHIAYIVR